MKPRIIFFGSSKYSVIDEKALSEAFGLTGVVTIPDRIDPKTKIHILSPVKIFAEKSSIPVIEADKLTPEFIKKIQAYAPDFLVVADYRLILPAALLSIPKYVSINVHHSLLPEFRGPSPAPAAILSGNGITGVTIINMNDKVDDGDILKQVTYQMRENETTDSLLTQLNMLGAKAACEAITEYRDGTIRPRKQDASKATFTKYLDKKDGFIDTTKPIDKTYVNRMIRAYYPWPGAWTKYREPNTSLTNKTIKFLPATSSHHSYTDEISNNEVFIQVEGKKPMTKKDFLNGYPFAKEWIEKII